MPPPPAIAEPSLAETQAAESCAPETQAGAAHPLETQAAESCAPETQAGAAHPLETQAAEAGPPETQAGAAHPLETQAGQARAGEAPPQLLQLPLAQLRLNPAQPRKRFPTQALEELARSLSTQGLIQPLVVRTHPQQPGCWELIAGERRLRAMRLLGWSSAPAVVREACGERLLELALVENLQREELTPIEEAQAYRALIQRFGYTQQALAARVGKDRSTIANLMRLLALPRAIQEDLETQRLTGGHARALLALPHADQQLALRSQLLAQGLSVRKTEALVHKTLARNRPPPPQHHAPQHHAPQHDAPQHHAPHRIPPQAAAPGTPLQPMPPAGRSGAEHTPAEGPAPAPPARAQAAAFAAAGSAPRDEPQAALWQHAARRLEQHLGARVRIQQPPQAEASGELRISFRGTEDFNRLFARLLQAQPGAAGHNIS